MNRLSSVAASTAVLCLGITFPAKAETQAATRRQLEHRAELRGVPRWKEKLQPIWREYERASDV
jgi:hypothetical protein